MNEAKETPKEKEHLLNWQDLDETHEAVVILSHAHAFKTREFDTLKRIFNVGNPDIIFGDNLEYCRVAKHNVMLMNMITSLYLK